MKVTWNEGIKNAERPNYPYLGKSIFGDCMIVYFTAKNTGVCLLDLNPTPSYNMEGKYDDQWGEITAFRVYEGDIMLKNKY